MVHAAELPEAARRERDGTDRDVGRLGEPALKPAQRRALPALGVVERDQRCQLERLGQLDLADLARGRLGGHQVAVLERCTHGGRVTATGATAAARGGGDDVDGAAVAHP